MPANIAHMLIAHKALQKLKAKGIKQFTEFAEMLDDTSRSKNYKAYVNLGSVGPDLYYYGKMAEGLKDMIVEGYRQAKGVTPWAYHLHSYKPNEFPLKLAEIIFRDAIRQKGKIKLEADDIRKLAYIAGHLTHIAADQIIHPVVNSVAGPYYRSGENRKEHRGCEVFQDYFLYQQVYRLEGKSGAKYDFFEQEFNRWADCVRGMTTRNSEDWFRYFLQRGFVETYGMGPEEEEIEDSVDNLLLTLRTCQALGPYKKAAKDYEKNGQNKGMCKKYIKDVKYIKYYRLAVELAVVYLIALYEVYFVLQQNKDFTEKEKSRFGNIVSGADLSCPLEQNILEKATHALQSKKYMDLDVKSHSSALLTRTKLISENSIFKSKDESKLVAV